MQFQMLILSVLASLTIIAKGTYAPRLVSLVQIDKGLHDKGIHIHGFDKGNVKGNVKGKDHETGKVTLKHWLHVIKTVNNASKHHKKHHKKTRQDEGKPCRDDSECASNYCHDATSTAQGTCESSSTVLVKCLWTHSGVAWALKADCDKTLPGRCPRVRDPVLSKYAWASGEWNEQRWKSLAVEGLMDCEAFVDECTFSKAFAESCKEDLPRISGKLQSKITCPEAGELVTYQHAADWMLPPKQHWPSLAEKGLVTCKTARQAYNLWAAAPLRAELIECGGISSNCATKEQAEKACKTWSSNAGSGTGKLCYKHELGERIGRKCRFMWTADSLHNEGCYESAGEKDAEDGKCEGDAGLVMCQKWAAPDKDARFDAACCEGHSSDPVAMYFPPTN